MIKSIIASGVQGRFNVEATFHPDINIITGINGSGKTTILKLLWYLVSANIERVFAEITFQHVTISTSKFDLTLTTEHHERGDVISITHNIPGMETLKRRREELAEEPPQLRALNRRASEMSGPTVFFPTFRRIEGGFSLRSGDMRRMRRRRVGEDVLLEYETRGDLDEAMRALSDRLSIGKNTFVASMSTDDIAQLITSRYAQISETTNELLLETARKILHSAGQVESGAQTAEEVLKQVAEAAKKTEAHQENLLRPFTVLSQLVKTLYRSKGIKVGSSMTLGDAQSAIGSDLLSAGEKQMLSFLVYNAFYRGAAVFIDEPEISLHVDWQRRLFSLLTEQGSGNQFFVATHSPFIYQKYADKEILLSGNRGD
jgi:predicted ATPase